MIVFADIQPSNVLMASVALVVLGLAFTFIGGLRSVIWSDLVQVVLYVGAALVVLWFLWSSIPVSSGDLVRGLATTPDGANKLRLIDLSLSPILPLLAPSPDHRALLRRMGSTGSTQPSDCRFPRRKRALYVSVLASITVVLRSSPGSLLSSSTPA